MPIMFGKFHHSVQSVLYSQGVITSAVLYIYIISEQYVWESDFCGQKGWNHLTFM